MVQISLNAVGIRRHLRTVGGNLVPVDDSVAPPGRYRCSACGRVCGNPGVPTFHETTRVSERLGLPQAAVWCLAKSSRFQESRTTRRLRHWSMWAMGQRRPCLWPHVGVRFDQHEALIEVMRGHICLQFRSFQFCCQNLRRNLRRNLR